jgi:AraC family transcriptional regulator of adaptative response/methylated-DNA-[protein]-cysteine methyltransferase
MHIMAEPSLASSDRRWQAVAARDAAADGSFVYAVKSTGVYCRPSCPSRLAKPQNVSFFDSSPEARAAGYRPCKRCRPDQASRRDEQTAKIAAACRMIETAEEMPRLDALAQMAQLSPYHFHRLFKAITGVTPKAYAKAQRTRRVQEELAKADTTVTAALYDAGFNSSGRFYDAAQDMLGMTPSAYRAGGANAEIRFAIGECSLGSILVARTAKGICAISLGDDPQILLLDLQNRFPNATLIGGDRAFETLAAKVIGLAEQPQLGLELPLDVRGTAFQQRVWQALRDIPAGATASYAEIARRIGQPSAVRAVAQACAANQIAIAIPCHRVVRTDGDVSGYRWGVERKKALLSRERAA